MRGWFYAGAIMAASVTVEPLVFAPSDRIYPSQPTASSLALGIGVRSLKGGPADLMKPKGKRARRRRKP